ncbi:hypothetical protein DV736_g3511, partial [Chaetothyriales sp. CBS 134916]
MSRSTTPLQALPSLQRRWQSQGRPFARAIPGLQRKLEGYTINRDIASRWVQVRNEQGKLSSPQMLDTLLSQIQPTTQVVRQLAAPGQGQVPDTAVVEVTEISALLKQVAGREQAAKELQKKARGAKPKQLELNWAISENDLELKMRQMDQFLDKGKKVELILAAKRRQRKATTEEADALMKKLDERVEQAGAKKVKMEGKLLGQATIMLQKI